MELDNLAAETAAHMSTVHPDYSLLASRIAVSNLQKCTKKVFSEVVKDLYEYVEPKTGEAAPLIAEDVYKVIMDNADRLDSAVIHDRDFGYNYFGFKTLERSYLLKINGQIAERPQQMLMRVSVGIHKDDIDGAIETYNLMSERWFTHASPTLFNAGTPRPQLSSCFLVAMKDDSIEGIYSTLTDCAKISKSAGGIGLHITNIRGTGSYIKGTNGSSNGIVPMLRVYNDTARYVDQGGTLTTDHCFACPRPTNPSLCHPLPRRKAQGRHCHLPRAVAPGHSRLFGSQEEPRQGGEPRARPLLRSVDPGSVHGARQGPGQVVAL